VNAIVNRGSWRLVYGAALVVLLMLGLLAFVVNVSSTVQQAIRAFGSLLFYGLLIRLGIWALFTALEWIIPAAGPRKPFRGYWLNFKVTLLDSFAGTFFGSVIGASVATLGSRLGLGLIDLRFSAEHNIGALILATLLSTFVFDFFFYWFHRFQHESPILWQEHKLHHMDEQLCAFYRQSWLESLLQGTATGVPIALLFKLNPTQGAIVGYVIFAWIVSYHSNIRLHLGWASVLLNCPQVHRIHHSRVHEHHDQNYAAFFPVWDVLFGTYHHPGRDEYPLTGVHDEQEVKSLREAATLPFREWRNMFRKWRASRRGSAPNLAGTEGAPKPVNGPKSPIEVQVESGKRYWWCACGLSKTQPFCDGSHKGTPFSPMQYQAKETGTKWFCICKQTKTPPFCDCTHYEF
jgi:sterol desaturase/sphingolipid hydroxylase (fatty acid hydroxylase superfamily)/CDGSH-type Zn-finger protein